jgi:insertion element IS1 protein InsB
LLQLKALLEPFGMMRYDPDGWDASARHLEAERPRVGKDHTQKIESQHLHLRMRIKRGVRRTLCFCKTERMPDLVIGLSINRYELGRLLGCQCNRFEPSSHFGELGWSPNQALSP